MKQIYFLLTLLILQTTAIRWCLDVSKTNSTDIYIQCFNEKNNKQIEKTTNEYDKLDDECIQDRFILDDNRFYVSQQYSKEKVHIICKYHKFPIFIYPIDPYMERNVSHIKLKTSTQTNEQITLDKAVKKSFSKELSLKGGCGAFDYCSRCACWRYCTYCYAGYYQYYYYKNSEWDPLTNKTITCKGYKYCYACSAGTYSDGKSTSCTSCSAGTYSGSAASSCKTCSAGYYSKSGASSCTKCSD